MKGTSNAPTADTIPYRNTTVAAALNMPTSKKQIFTTFPSGKLYDSENTTVTSFCYNPNRTSVYVDGAWVYDSAGNFIDILSSVSADCDKCSVMFHIKFNSSYSGRLLRIDFIDTEV